MTPFIFICFLFFCHGPQGPSLPEAQRRRLYNAWLDRQAEEHKRKQARKGTQAEDTPGDEQQPRQDFDSDSEGRPGASQVSSSHRSQKSRGSAWLAQKKKSGRRSTAAPTAA